jgi:hypothetical protein
MQRKVTEKKSRQTRWLRPFCLTNASPCVALIQLVAKQPSFLDSFYYAQQTFAPYTSNCISRLFLSGHAEGKIEKMRSIFFKKIKSSNVEVAKPCGLSPKVSKQSHPAKMESTTPYLKQ